MRQLAHSITSKPQRFGLWITLVAALVYCAWLGAHWLPLGMSDKELAASASRVWDIKREIVQHHSLPWWTPYYMSGSSYGLNKGFLGGRRGGGGGVGGGKGREGRRGGGEGEPENRGGGEREEKGEG